MAFKPNSLLEELEAGNVLVLFKQKNRHSPPKFECPCGAWVPATRIVDLRQANDFDQDWACDGCWSKWMREAGPNGSPERKAWMRKWLTELGAPQEAIDRHN